MYVASKYGYLKRIFVSYVREGKKDHFLKKKIRKLVYTSVFKYYLQFLNVLPD